MSNPKKAAKLIAYATGVILLLLLGMALLAPKLINTAMVKEKLLHELSRRVAGTVTFRSLDVALFPSPRLVIEQAGIALPEKMEATVTSLKIYPHIMPLFSGEVKIAEVQARDPAIRVYVSGREESKPLSVEAVSAAVRALVSDSAGLVVTVENGNLSLGKVGQVPASFQQVDARIVFKSKKDVFTVTFDRLKAASPRLMLSGSLSIHPSSPRINLDIRGKELTVGPLRDFALSTAKEAPPVRIIFDIVRDGNVPDISFHSQGDSFQALGAIMNMEIKGELEEGKIHVPGPGLDFTAVKGKCVLSQGMLQGTNITGRYGNSDLQQASLKLAVQGGDAPFHLDTLFRADLAEVPALLGRLVKDRAFSDELSQVQSLSGSARGSLVLGGSIAAVKTRVTVSDLSLSARYQRIPLPITLKGGAFTYDEQQVSVKDLTGTVGQTAFSGMTARMDQGKTPRLALVAGKIRIHAGELHGWLSSVEELRPSLKDITAASGTITLSSLAVNGPALSPRAWIVTAAGAIEGLTVTSPLIPAPLALICRSASYDRKGLSVKELSATMGRSSVTELDADLQSGDSPSLTIRSARATIDTGEMYRWLAAHEKMKASLRDISGVGGTITLSSVALQGPVTVPEEWRFKTTGSAANLVVGSPSLPDNLTLRQAKFTISPRRIVLEGAQAGMLDATATISGALTVSSEGPLESDVSLDAETGPRGMQWIKTAAGLPPILRVQQKLSVARGRIVTSTKGDFAFQGTLTTKGGQTLGLDLLRDKKEMRIAKLDIVDAASRASITLGLRENTVDATFSGRLDSSTVAALLEIEQLPAGRLEGDFSAHVLRDRPAGSTARGKLTGEKILLPWKPGIPVHIDALSVSAEGSRVTVLSSRLRLADIALSSSGTFIFGKDGVDVNMEVEADRVEWKSLEKIIADERATEQAAGGGASSGMTFRGTVKISAREFVFQKFTISPLQADIAFSPGQAAAHIREAALCGISALGRIGLAGSEQTADITLAARNQDLGPSIVCLSERAEMTGSFSLDGRLVLPLKGVPLLRGLEGTLSFRAGEGKINKSVPLSKIFALLSVTEYFRGLPNLRDEGFAFSTAAISGDIHQGTLSLKQAIIDGATMTITAEGTADLAEGKANITVLAAPFKTVDTMLKKLPGRKQDSRASLVSMGVRVTGDLKNPDVAYQPLSGISRGLSAGMEKILKAPIRIIEPFMPREKK